MADIQQAIKLYNIRNYKDAYPIFKKLAKSSSEANYYLGLMFYHGYYPKQDYKQAFRYFKTAWEDLYPESIYMMGVCYEEGHGTKQDLNHAFKLYEAAAKSGSVDAMLKVAKFYEQGIAVEKSLKQAIQTYIELKNRENAYAMYKIGTFYLTGTGLKKSIDSARLWLNKALSYGSVEAMNYFRYLGLRSKTDSRTTDDIMMTGKALLEKHAYEDAVQYFEIAAKEKNLEGIFILSDLYKQGLGVEKSLEKSFNTLLKYQDLNNAELYLRIGKKYELGEGIGSSYIKAAMFYELAKNQGNEKAATELLELRGY